MATLNVGMKVNRAIAGGTTVTANAYAMVSYSPSFYITGPGGGSFGGASGFTPIVRYFGPGQSIPASFTTTYPAALTNVGSSALTGTVTWSLLSGVELINTI